MSSYPATLIGRFDVPSKFKGNGIGFQIINFVKVIILTQDTHKCRFIIVDSYNTENALKFYLKNDFQFLFQDEKLEEAHYNNIILKTRFMYFDLLNWIPAIKDEI